MFSGESEQLEDFNFDVLSLMENYGGNPWMTCVNPWPSGTHFGNVSETPSLDKRYVPKDVVWPLVKVALLNGSDLKCCFLLPKE